MSLNTSTSKSAKAPCAPGRPAEALSTGGRAPLRPVQCTEFMAWASVFMDAMSRNVLRFCVSVSFSTAAFFCIAHITFCLLLQLCVQFVYWVHTSSLDNSNHGSRCYEDMLGNLLSNSYPDCRRSTRNLLISILLKIVRASTPERLTIFLPGTVLPPAVVALSMAAGVEVLAWAASDTAGFLATTHHLQLLAEINCTRQAEDLASSFGTEPCLPMMGHGAVRRKTLTIQQQDTRSPANTYVLVVECPQHCDCSSTDL
jgi:hypothetical protein